MLLKFLAAMFGISSVRDCSNGKGRASLIGFDSQPANPVAGDNVSLWIAYDLPDPAITAGTATYAFTLNGIPFPATIDDLCTQTVCPKEVGFNNETSSSIFPSGVSGKIVSSISWKDQNNDLVWCVETTWRVS
jgi:hypothetical protein